MLQSAEVGPIPEVVNPARRAACGQSLHLYLATYFPDTTGKDLFSADHVRMIDRMESCLRGGGRVLNCVYRGFAKTTITENAVLWATSYGYRRFIPIFGADEAAANLLLESILSELEENDLLAEDFPEICLPFHHLEGKPQRCGSQTQGGERTHIKTGKGLIVFPTIWLDDACTVCSPGSGAVIRARGLMQGTRGMAYKRPDGSKARPDFAVLDDPQTDESATHAGQVETRLTLLRKAILKSAGHQSSMACVINATLIAEGDMVDQLLDQEKNPSWDGERIPMVKKWADEHEGLWLEYAKIRRGFSREIPGDQDRAKRDATEFYRANREAMDAGAVVSWKACFDPKTELSSIQHAYNLFIDDPPEVFDSECQCKPAAPPPEGVPPLDNLTIQRKVNGFKRTEVPGECTTLTGSIDVHDDVLYWGVCGWTQGARGSLVDYGTYPEQRRSYFTKRQATNTLARKFPGLSDEARIIAGIEALAEQLCAREWLRTNKTPIRIEKLVIDSGYAMDEVETVCRRSPFAGLLQMSRGRGFRAGDTPIKEYQRRPGWKFGEDWYLPPAMTRSLRILWFDSNAWKTWLRKRLATAIGEEGSLTLYGRSKETDHRLIADHLLAERPTETQGRGRTVIEWNLVPGSDNHWLDVLVGCSVAANFLGCSLVEKPAKPVGSKQQRALDAARKRGMLSE